MQSRAWSEARAGFSPEPSATCVWPSKPLAWISEMAKCGCAELPKRPEEPRPLLQAHLWGGPPQSGARKSADACERLSRLARPRCRPALRMRQATAAKPARCVVGCCPTPSLLS